MRPIVTGGVLALAALVITSCHASYRPFEIADRCDCGRDQYCRIASAGTSRECLPIPPTCSDPPTCACLGHPEDACREELGRFWVFERRSVAGCDDCSAEEYCASRPAASAATQPAQCALLPPQCEDEPTCACMEQNHRLARGASCSERGARLEIGLASPR